MNNLYFLYFKNYNILILKITWSDTIDDNNYVIINSDNTVAWSHDETKLFIIDDKIYFFVSRNKNLVMYSQLLNSWNSTWTNYEVIYDNNVQNIMYSVVLDDQKRFHIILSSDWYLGATWYLMYTYKYYTDWSDKWKSNLQNDITSDAFNYNPINKIVNFAPKLFIKNNILYVASVSHMWYSYDKYGSYILQTKNLGDSNSKFVTNKYPVVNDPIFFVWTQNNGCYLNTYPSIYVDNDNVIHYLFSKRSLGNANYSNYANIHYAQSTNWYWYSVNSYVSCMTNNLGNIDTNNWTLIKNIISEDEKEYGNIYYSVCFVDNLLEKWCIFSGSNSRIIMKYDTSLTVNNCFINTDLTFGNENFVLAQNPSITTNSDQNLIKNLEQAVNDIVTNRMQSDILNGITTFPFVPGTTKKIRMAIIMKSNNEKKNVKVNDISIKYNANSSYDNKTNNYEIKIKSLSSLLLTAPSDGLSRNAIIYVSNSTNSINSTSKTSQMQSTQSITQSLTWSYTALNINSGANINIIKTWTFSVINGWLFQIIQDGKYEIEINFNFSVDVPILQDVFFNLLSWGTELQKKTCNTSNFFDIGKIKTIVNVVGTYDFSLYFKSSIVGTNNITFDNVNIFVNKLI